MLLLTFRVAQDLYAVDAARVAEVVPRVEPRPIPRTPAFLAGLFGYRGRVVPAIDLGLLLGNGPSPGRLSTRVILVEARRAGGVNPLSSSPPVLRGSRRGFPEPGRSDTEPPSIPPEYRGDVIEDRGFTPPARQDTRQETPSARQMPLLLGLIAEQVNDVIRVDQDGIVFPSMRLDDAPYLGAMIQVDSHAQSLAQMIDVDWVLPPALRDALFGGWEKTDEHAETSPDADRGEAENAAETGVESKSELDLGVAAR
jgi:chemotaxis-related protein WspB